MSRDGAAAGEGTDDRVRPDLPAALEAIRDNALRILADLPRPPTALRIRAGELTLEVEWSAIEPPPSAAPSGTGAPPRAPANPAGQAATSGGQHYVRAPMVGVFYRAPEPGAEPFVSEGDVVAPGQQIGIVEAMKLMIPVNADVHGTVVAILPEDGAEVEYDEQLIVLAPLGTGDRRPSGSDLG